MISPDSTIALFQNIECCLPRQYLRELFTKNYNSIINNSPSSYSKPVWVSFFYWAQKIFGSFENILKKHTNGVAIDLHSIFFSILRKINVYRQLFDDQHDNQIVNGNSANIWSVLVSKPAIDFHSMESNIMEVSGYCQRLLISILQKNLLLCPTE